MAEALSAVQFIKIILNYAPFIAKIKVVNYYFNIARLIFS
jgi:hypothetical protein